MLQKKIIRLAEIDDNSGKGEVIREKSNINNTIVTFDAPTTRVPPASGDTMTTIVGKILKYITDMKQICFTGSYNNLTDVPTAFTPKAHSHTQVGTRAPSDTTFMWIDTGNGGIHKYYNGAAWVPVKSTWG